MLMRELIFPRMTFCGRPETSRCVNHLRPGLILPAELGKEADQSAILFFVSSSNQFEPERLVGGTSEAETFKWLLKISTLRRPQQQELEGWDGSLLEDSLTTPEQWTFRGLNRPLTQRDALNSSSSSAVGSPVRPPSDRHFKAATAFPNFMHASNSSSRSMP